MDDYIIMFMKIDAKQLMNLSKAVSTGACNWYDVVVSQKKNSVTPKKTSNFIYTTIFITEYEYRYHNILATIHIDSQEHERES